MMNTLPFLHEYDLSLIGNAVLVCMASSLAAVAVLAHVQRPGLEKPNLWILSAAIVGGFGIWATHFTAMVGYHQSVHGQSAHGGYQPGMTAASLGIIVLGLFVAFKQLILAQRPIARMTCGALVGLSIVTMHYLGMAAYVSTAVVRWNYNFVAISILIAIAFGSITMLALVRADQLRSRIVGASALATTTLCVHFSAMAAYKIVGICSADSKQALLVPGNQTIAIVGSALLIATMTYLGVFLHGRDQALRTEMRHMEELANATIEALLICDGEKITAANETFANLIGVDSSITRGDSLAKFLPLSRADRTSLNDGNPIECTLHTSQGGVIPVEVHTRDLAFAGKRQLAYAILDVRKRREAEEAIKRLASEDQLTQLPNRNAFYTNLRTALEFAAVHSTKLALICIDLDHFKEINDQYGHRVGDEFLQRAARVMQSALTGDQILGRVGGDEFALILPNILDVLSAEVVAAEILEAFAQDNVITGTSVKLSGSLGIALFPDHAHSKMELLTAADSAMYKAKREGRNRFQVFDTVLALDSQRHRELIQEIKASMIARDFRVVYQPRLSCSTGHIIGKEALARWSSAKYGNISPSNFIAIAEECGEICKIGDWVLEQACTDAAGWNDKLSVSVNVSPVQLINEDFIKRIHEILLHTGLSPHRLELEITETALIHNFNRVLHVLRGIKALGVSIAMDDFGTGYSSLYNLRSFPFDKIKIDKSFIRNVHRDDQASAIVRAAIGLARGLGLQIVAEGVENSDEYNYLKGIGCDELQGFFIGMPTEIIKESSLLGRKYNNH